MLTVYLYTPCHLRFLTQQLFYHSLARTGSYFLLPAWSLAVLHPTLNRSYYLMKKKYMDTHGLGYSGLTCH